ncbi:hypothetical protein ABIA65_003835 [Mycolicibacterium sp. 624]
MQFRCHCGKVVSQNASPPPDEFWIISSSDEETALESWADAAADYVAAIRNDRRDSWMAQHFSHLPDASDRVVLSDLLDSYLLPHQRLDVVCSQCGRLWRQDEPHSPEHRSFLPEG